MKTFEDYGINTKRSSGKEKLQCPECTPTRRNKRDKSLSVDHDKQVWNCHNCGWAGGLKPDTVKQEKEYTLPVENNSGVSDKVLQWFEGRGISKATVMHFNTGEERSYMPAVGDHRNCITFPYYRDGKLINVKYRDGQKKFKLVSGAELIFFNLDAIKDRKEVVIVEGEPDAYAYYEAGIFNVISVPNGASLGNQNLQYLDSCVDDFDRLEKIYIATDNDDAGRALENELVRRLGRERCYRVHYPEGCKDANEVLVAHGPEEVKMGISEATEYPIEGIETVADKYDDLQYIYEFGYPQVLPIGYRSLDPLFGLRTGEVTMVTGSPGSGKSEFLDQILHNMARRYGWKAGIFSAENQPSTLHMIKLAEKYAEMAYHGYNRMPPELATEALQFVQDHFSFVKISDENLSVEGLMARCRELVKRKGIKIFVIDPYNYLDHKRNNNESETDYISRFMSLLTNTAKILDIHIFLVAHPTKLKKEKGPDGVMRYVVAELYDIAGSAHFKNKTDNGMSIFRDFETNTIRVYIQKVRFKFVGRVGHAEFTYNINSGTYREIGASPYDPVETESYSALDEAKESYSALDYTETPF